MAKIVKKNKKIVRRHSGRKEVEIPVFVISKKEQIPPSAKENQSVFEEKGKGSKEFGILKDKEDLPVFENFLVSSKETKEKDVEKEWSNLKVSTHKKDTGVLVSGKKGSKKAILLSESGRRIIMWASVAVFACLIFFIWFSSLKNNFFNFFGSVSYTFARQEGALEEVDNGLEELENQTNASLEEAETEAGDNDEGVLDQIKEKILVEELKNKLE